METRERIKELLKSTERKGMESLLEWMEDAGFFDAPCSSKYHLSEPGGLAKHSLNVLEIAIEEIVALYRKNIEAVTFDFINSVTICALLHDIGKAGQFGKPNYKIKEILTDEEPLEYPKPLYATNKDLLFIPHEVRSIAILSKFIVLTEEEQFAILYHNGLYGELKGFKGKETPLLMILHAADMWASRVVEKG